MESVDPDWTTTVVVCCNERVGRACCGRAAGEALRDTLRDWARQQGLKKDLVVHRGSCMGVCGAGTTVAVHTRSTREVWVVEPREAAVLCAHLVKSVKG